MIGTPFRATVGTNIKADYVEWMIRAPRQIEDASVDEIAPTPSRPIAAIPASAA